MASSDMHRRTTQAVACFSSGKHIPRRKQVFHLIRMIVLRYSVQIPSIVARVGGGSGERETTNEWQSANGVNLINKLICTGIDGA